MRRSSVLRFNFMTGAIAGRMICDMSSGTGVGGIEWRTAAIQDQGDRSSCNMEGTRVTFPALLTWYQCCRHALLDITPSTKLVLGTRAGD
jgi:hypothetical protein